MQPADHVALHALRVPRRPAAVDLASGRRWTYAELDSAIGRCAALLRRRWGCAAEDRVASLARNSVDLLILHLACVRAALIYVPLNWRLAPAEIARLIADCEPRLVFGDGELGRAGLEGITLGELAAALEEGGPLAAGPPPPPLERVSLILYTSGTSGRPKGVMHSESSLVETAINFGLLGEVGRDAVFLVDSPMFHVIGLVTCLRPPLMQSGRVLISDGFEPARTLARLGDPALGVTHYFCVPQMADRLRAEPGFDPRRFAGLTGIFTGGAPHPAGKIRAWLDAGVTMVDGYGMSEVGTVLGMALDPTILAAKAGSAGVSAPGIGLRLVDAADRDVEPGMAGELLLHGKLMFSGYWRQPETTRAAFTADGWFRTGDILRRDADGFFSVVDRKKDMFISGGENVYPAEIEAELAGLTGLVEAAVVGVPDPQWGEVGLCALVPADEEASIVAVVEAHLATRLARFKRPRHYVVIERLPRTGSGKVSKGELRRMWLIPSAVNSDR